jgi:hypothetical protein
MANLGFLAEPAVVSAIAGFGTALLTLAGKAWVDRKASRDKHRYTDQQLHEMSITQFRDTLIQQLTQCHQSYDLLEKEYALAQRQIIAHERSIARAEFMIEQLCSVVKRLDPSFDCTPYSTSRKS